MRINRYGWIHKAYLEKHCPGLYEKLILSGELYHHLLEIDQDCRERIERIISWIAEVEGVDEQMKASDQLRWVPGETVSNNEPKQLSLLN